MFGYGTIRCLHIILYARSSPKAVNLYAAGFSIVYFLSSLRIKLPALPARRWLPCRLCRRSTQPGAGKPASWPTATTSLGACEVVVVVVAYTATHQSAFLPAYGCAVLCEMRFIYYPYIHMLVCTILCTSMCTCAHNGYTRVRSHC